MEAHHSPSSRLFNCTVVEGNVQCSSPGSQEHIIIPIHDIGKEDSPSLESIRINSIPSKLLSDHLCTELPRHLGGPNDESTKVHIIISTKSGTGIAKLIFSHVLKPLLEGIGLTEYEVHETQSAQTIIELCHSLFVPKAEAGILQTIILLSGDGGLCDLIDTFYGLPKVPRTLPNIAIIPAGTGNALANSTGLFSHPKTPFVTLLFGKPLAIPVFIARFSAGASYIIEDGFIRAPILRVSDIAEPYCPRIFGSVVASWGIHAALVADSDTMEYRKFGAERFKMAAKELLNPSDGSETHKYIGTITLIRQNVQDSNEHEETIESNEHMYMLGTLVSNLEKGFTISPQSRPLDGSLRIIRFGPVTPERAMHILSSAYQNGRHVQDEEVTYVDVEGFRINFHEKDERWRRVCIDGRVVVVEEGGWMEVRKEERYLLNLLSPVSPQCA